ncbi:putative mind kinetochore complex component protein [Zalerion maritima]|uniref:Mind kinetochore complex component protein n=1 Tax=Zalerion maritima TaxID=339359 RepID=A0AAD5RMJ9_9PEZI|nr:putative mind kinetochore complex component protein [Zalerion maritima]
MSQAENPGASQMPPEAAGAPRPSVLLSPPMPPRPVAQTPGPRAQRLQQLYAQSLRHTLNKISWDNFSACYPTIGSQAPGVLKAVQKQMVDRLLQLCNNEFDLIMTQRNVVAKLNELEELTADAAKRREDGDGEPPVAPHTLPPETILAAHLAPHLVAHQSQLNARIQTIQSKNAALWEEVQSQRAEIATMLEGLDNAVNDLDGATELLEPIVDDVGKETRDIEMEMETAKEEMGCGR